MDRHSPDHHRLSSRPERSGAEGPAVAFFDAYLVQNMGAPGASHLGTRERSTLTPPQTCHLERMFGRASAVCCTQCGGKRRICFRDANSPMNPGAPYLPKGDVGKVGTHPAANRKTVSPCAQAPSAARSAVASEESAVRDANLPMNPGAPYLPKGDVGKVGTHPTTNRKTVSPCAQAQPGRNSGL